MSQVLLEVGALVLSADAVIAEPGYILWQDGVILAVGRGVYPGPRDKVEVISRPRAVAIPGLVNTHGHAAMTLLRGIGDDLPLQAWLTERIYPAEAKLTGEAVYWGTLLACWEMIQSGTTCFTDMYFFMHDAARAVEESGLRAVLSWGMVGFDEQSRTQGIRNSRSFHAQWHRAAQGRIQVTLGPHAPYTCPPDYLAVVAELSAELGVPIQIHLSETKREVDECIAEHGCTPIRLVERCGLLDRPVLAAHCVHLTEEDIALLRERDVRVAHNPQSNLKLASGVAPVVELLQAGVTVGIGTDGAASNNNLDLFEELRLAATLHKGVRQDATAVTAGEAFTMATSAGAQCVFLPDGHGTLHPGAAADIVLLSLDSAHFLPTYDLLSNIVYAAGAGDVTDVFVAGQPLLRQGEPVTLDVERIRHEVRRLEAVLGPRA
ncbi:MAG: amidohydrolase [Alicyclobacillus macrosporangiidus]|uniref:amidohydrolase n=1 Tax=Alicyclobacillus macrosporangiidus TaxID=392015 RepID=UPI0026ED0CA3|nr:amidohydrolase [Alicyclobacillus macrosporangiidus]MCL6598650.1 amidohydrolase [Alicyclobacillus macrosporangiidus]